MALEISDSESDFVPTEDTKGIYEKFDTPGRFGGIPKLFTQTDLNDLVRDLDLTKNSAELLASRLKDKNLSALGIVVSFYRNRERDLVQFFRMEDKFVFCGDINGLLNAMGCEYEPTDWRLFMNSSKRKLKCVLLHNGNVFASIPISNSVQIKESHGSMKQVLEKLKYSEHNWKICGDLKLVCILLGQKGRYTKYPCFLCLWESHAKKDHWVKQDWPKRTEFVIGEKISSMNQRNFFFRHCTSNLA